MPKRRAKKDTEQALITDNPNSSSSKNKKADAWGITKITEQALRRKLMDKLDCHPDNPMNQITKYDYCHITPNEQTADCENCPYSGNCEKELIR